MNAPPPVIVEVAAGVATVTLNRPERLNAIDDTSLDLLEEAFDRIDGDRAIRVAILTGAGERAFTVGIDFEVLGRGTDGVARFVARELVSLYDRVVRSRVPVIAAVEGLAYATGAEVPLCCDLVYAGSGARFCLPDLGLGLASASARWKASEKLSRMRLAELAYTCREFGAEEAHEVGLVTRIVPAGAALATARETAALIAARAPTAVEVTKRAFSAGYADDWSAFLELQREAIRAPEFAESVAALAAARASRHAQGR